MMGDISAFCNLEGLRISRISPSLFFAELHNEPGAVTH